MIKKIAKKFILFTFKIGTVHEFMKNKDLDDTYIRKIGILFVIFPFIQLNKLILIFYLILEFFQLDKF